MNGTVYLLHFEPGLRVRDGVYARHYIGWTSQPPEDRLAEHMAGNGSPLVKAAVAAGADVRIARLWFGVDRHFERRLKNRREAPRLCPLCVLAGKTAGRSAMSASAATPYPAGAAA